MEEKAVALAALGILLAVFCFPARSMGGGANRGHMSWNVLDTTKPDDRVFGDAVVAELTVKLVSFDGGNPADVYGTITATFGGSSGRVVLFKHSEDDTIPVGQGNPIPLKESVVKGVPFNSRLTIKANLQKYNEAGTDGEIANGVASFVPRSSGSDSRTIDGKSGQIQAEVIWNEPPAVDDSKSTEMSTGDE